MDKVDGGLSGIWQGGGMGQPLLRLGVLSWGCGYGMGFRRMQVRCTSPGDSTGCLDLDFWDFEGTPCRQVFGNPRGDSDRQRARVE